MINPDKGLEKVSLGKRAYDLLKSGVPDMDIEMHESAGKTVLVCDFEPCRVEDSYFPHVGRKIPGQERYEKFWKVYRDTFFHNHDYYSTNISSQGITDLIDVREVVDLKAAEKIYIMSKQEWAKLNGVPFTPKNAGIAKELKAWSDKNSSLVGDAQQITALQALSGRGFGQLTAVASGVKPLSVEINLEDESVMSIVKNLSNVRSFTPVASVDTHGHKDHVIYNPQAVQKIIDDNQTLFKKIGLLGKAHDVVVKTLLEVYASGSSRGYDKRDIYQALGLLLGYDAKSCQDYRNKPAPDWSKIFMPPDHIGSHPMNANPFNFYDTDYWISDEANNPDFHKLKREYEKLVKRIEELLKKGLSPLEVLSALNENSPEVLDELIAGTKKKVEDLTK